MDNKEQYLRDLRTYVYGFLLAVVLTVAAFWAALGSGWAPGTVLSVVGFLGLIQLSVHLRYFLHIDRSRQQREDLDLILFTSLVVLIIVLGTIWVLGNLHERMHMHM
ncbi:cytochrome C oxidase [Ruegeria sp. ANG-R]|uniref:cytochrome o ubiquinol oxidase subunit IV n=1 Tax=Ruegeria sp. ANG-R TaxID=1577903 RepID=UPI0005800DAC|nr:cytochrome o ubiquinol oxidase subunit IV [Ruegeria sp. ANG-R]KIC40192.1 cytochrome C oxidase [Ruegeria sp. ANG-R]